MLEILAIITGVIDLVTVAFATAKHWRISCGFLVAASALVVICFLSSSPAIRWIVGFHVFVLVVMVAIAWEEKRGKPKD